MNIIINVNSILNSLSPNHIHTLSMNMYMDIKSILNSYSWSPSPSTSQWGGAES